MVEKDVPLENIVVPPDVELFLCGWLRSALRRRGYDVEVSNKEPADLSFPLGRPLIVIRDDGGPQTEIITYNRAVTFNVLGGTRQDTKPTMDLARLVYALAMSGSVCLAEGSPIAAVDRTTGRGPYLVNDTADTTRAYITVDYLLVGDTMPIYTNP